MKVFETLKLYDPFIEKLDGLILLILMLILFFTPLAAGTEKGISVLSVHALVFLMLSLWLIEIVIQRRVDFIKTPLDYPIIIFVILSTLSATFSINPRQSFWYLLTFFDYIAIYYLIINKVRDQEQINLLIYSIITAGSLVALWGILTYLGFSGGRELNSNYLNPNPLAAYLAMIVPLAIVMMILVSDVGKKIIIGYCLCLMIIAFILTLSRGGWFSLLGGLLFMAVLHIYCKRSSSFHSKIFISTLLIIIFTLFSTFVLGFVNIQRELSGLSNPYQRVSVNGRSPIWKGTIEIIRDNPWLGTGPGTFPLIYTKYIRQLAFEYAHSEYLQTMSEWGGFSLPIILTILTLFFSKLSKCISIHIQDICII